MNDKINVKLLISILVVICLAVAVIYNTIRLTSDNIETATDITQVTTEQPPVEETISQTTETETTEVYTDDTSSDSIKEGAVSISNGNNSIYVGEINIDENVNIDVDGFEISTETSADGDNANNNSISIGDININN